jgi:hypothetical protein
LNARRHLISRRRAAGWRLLMLVPLRRMFHVENDDFISNFINRVGTRDSDICA